MSRTDILPRSMTMVRVGGKTYPARFESTCKTCQSPYRHEIESQLLQGRSYKVIIDHLVSTYADGGPKGHPGKDSLSNHLRGNHMPLNAVVEREIIERRSAAIGLDVENAARTLVDHVVANETIIERGFQRLQAGEIQPTMRDLLTAIRNQIAIEADAEDGLDSEVWRTALMEYMAILGRVLTPEQRVEFARLADASPVLRALTAQEDEADPIDGEVV
jgi:hypothetical protein